MDYNSDSGSLNRLVNSGNAFEGTTLPPRPSGGRRVPTIHNFKILRQETVTGGALVTLGWIQDDLTENDSLEIFVFGDDVTPQSSNQNPRDVYKNVVNQTPIVNGFKASESPVTLFIPARYRIPVTIALFTRHSSGMLSDYDFLNALSTVIDPGTSIIDYQGSIAEITLDTTDLTMFTTDIPANTIGQGKGIKINFCVNHSTGTANVLFKLFFGASSIVFTDATGIVGKRTGEVLILNNPLSIVSQTIAPTQPIWVDNMALRIPWDNSSDIAKALTIDTSSMVNVKLTANGAITEKVTPLYWLIDTI